MLLYHCQALPRGLYPDPAYGVCQFFCPQPLFPPFSPPYNSTNGRILLAPSLHMRRQGGSRTGTSNYRLLMHHPTYRKEHPGTSSEACPYRMEGGQWDRGSHSSTGRSHLQWMPTLLLPSDLLEWGGREVPPPLGGWVPATMCTHFYCPTQYGTTSDHAYRIVNAHTMYVPAPALGEEVVGAWDAHACAVMSICHVPVYVPEATGLL